MFRSLKSKILSITIVLLLVFNIGLLFFIKNELEGKLKNQIKIEMDGVRLYTINSFKYYNMFSKDQGDIIEKVIYDVYNNFKSYIAIHDDKGYRINYNGKVMNDSDIKELLKLSNNNQSMIKYRMDQEYITSFVYPIYINEKFNSNLILQKNYNDEYSTLNSTCKQVLFYQISLSFILIMILNYFIKRTLNPLKVLRNSIKKFGQDSSVEDIEVLSRDEVGEVTVAFNEMKNEREKLQKSSNEFFNNVTHELKTPITSIYSYLQILEEGETDKEFKERAINRMLLECNKMSSLVQNLLEISRREVRQREKKKEFDLKVLIENIFFGLEGRIVKLNKKVILNLEHLSIEGVFNEIEQIILNLIDNALKYSKDDSINIELKENVLSISNRFRYIPEEIKCKLLEPFIKFNPNALDNNRNISSSGIGLYLCLKLAEINNIELTYRIFNDEITFILKFLNQK